MNKKLYIMLLVGLVIGLLCVFFPPRRYSRKCTIGNVEYQQGDPAGRGCIVTNNIHRSVITKQGRSALAKYYIDVQKMILELVLIGFLTAIVVVSFKIRDISKVTKRLE